MTDGEPGFWTRIGRIWGRGFQASAESGVDSDTAMLLRDAAGGQTDADAADGGRAGAGSALAGPSSAAAPAAGGVGLDAVRVEAGGGGDSKSGSEAVGVDAAAASIGKSSRQRSSGSESSDSLPTCLICLEPMTLTSPHVLPLGCGCKGAAAYRHRACLERWLHVKGDTVCDVCRSEMTAVSLPPPPPVPGYVVFPHLDHSFEVQWETFGKYLWHNMVAIVVYCVVFALVMDIRLYVALLIAASMICLLLVRYVVTVAINTLARRTVLSFQAPDAMNPA